MDILGTSNKEEEQFYKLELTDYALPGFCSGGASYYGTLDGVKDFISAMRKQSDADLDGLEKALNAYLAGEQSVKHSVAYSQEQFLVPVELVESKVQFLENYKWTHTNIWGFPYHMKIAKGTAHEVVLKDGENYVRCVKLDAQKLMHCGEPPCDHWMSIGAGFWGFPGLLRYEKRGDRTFTDLFFVESVSQNLKECLSEIGQIEKLNFKSFCDSIFGDG